MKTIDTLIPDIYALLKRKDGWFNDELARSLSDDISKRLQEQLGKDSSRNTLRLSQMGPRCPKAVWCSVHHPELADPIPPWGEIKFAFGHIIEALAITLAKAAGHTVEGEQDAVTLDGIDGHRDCVIDGMVVDVKSSSTRSFEKFKNRKIKTDDLFGYLDQLDGYVLGSALDPIVKVKDQGALLAIDKQLGHMVLYKHRVDHDREAALRDRIEEYKRIIALPSPPHCQCGTKPEGATGNIRLDTRASYSPFKYFCHPFLRTFLYSSGPVYLTKVVREPDVKEINREGKVIY